MKEIFLGTYCKGCKLLNIDQKRGALIKNLLEEELMKIKFCRKEGVASEDQGQNLKLSSIHKKDMSIKMNKESGNNM